MYKNGEDFLDKLYKDLYLSDEVMHTAINNNKYVDIKIYMDRLDHVNHDINRKKKKNYYIIFIIKNM